VQFNRYKIKLRHKTFFVRIFYCN